MEIFLIFLKILYIKFKILIFCLIDDIQMINYYIILLLKNINKKGMPKLLK